MLNKLVSTLENNKVKLVAVSKNQPPERILEHYRRGRRDFGENRVQEMLDKSESLPKDIRWHLIGHLQTNKVKYIAPFVHLVHSVDSLKLLQEIDRQGRKQGRVIDCLLQFHIAREETKFGLELPEARALLDHCAQYPLPNVRLCGVMGMATQTEDPRQVRLEFQNLRKIKDALQAEYFPNAPHFREISMGMSGDWEIAVEEGSTMVRVGSLLFD
jgi:PLP dependent protein